MKNNPLTKVSEYLINGEATEIINAVNGALEAGIPAQTILRNGLLEGMSAIGRQFRDNEVYIPDVILAAETMKLALGVLKPLLSSGFAFYQKKVVIGTVQNDLHDLGKSIVCFTLESAGFMVIDLGVDVSAARFVEAVKKEKPDILALSCVLTTTLPSMAETVSKVRQIPEGKQLKILVGGLPVTQKLARSIGADGYGVDADVAMKAALQLVAKDHSGASGS